MERKDIKTLYLLGGAHRVGKSTIMSNLIKEASIPGIAADSFSEGLRSMLTGNTAWKKLGQVHIAASGISSNNFNEKPWDMSQTTDEDNLTRRIIEGVLGYYTRNRVSLAMEGSIITPEWARTINPDGYYVRVAFVGYTSDSHAEIILNYARHHKNDWINWRLKAHNGDDTEVRKWVAEEAMNNQELARRARELGYPFFDITAQPFHQYLQAVRDYFLRPAD